MALINSINNSSSRLTIQPLAAQDAQITFSNTADFISMGYDDDAGDSFKLSIGGALGTGDAFIITQAGENTLPLQSGFSAYRNSQVTNISGAGTQYTTSYDVTSYDQNSDFDGTTFTAPIDGRYLFNFTYSIQGVTAAMTRVITYIVNSGVADFLLNSGSAAVMRDDNDTYGANQSILEELDAADTVDARILVLNGAGNTADFGLPNTAGTQVTAFFSGRLKF